jgi:hypothetical protein
MVEGIWGNFKKQIEKFKIPTALLLCCSISPFAFHAFTLHAFTVSRFTLHEKSNLPYPSLRKRDFKLGKCLIHPPL